MRKHYDTLSTSMHANARTQICPPPPPPPPRWLHEKTIVPCAIVLRHPWVLWSLLPIILEERKSRNNKPRETIFLWIHARYHKYFFVQMLLYCRLWVKFIAWIYGTTLRSTIFSDSIQGLVIFLFFDLFFFLKSYH